MPFIVLARRLLSICANSASCERLFSVFGATLTKLRNRLGTETLTSLSELKMRVRDEHLQRETRGRLKRRFAVPPPTETEASFAADPPADATTTPPDHDSHTASITSAVLPNEFRATAERYSRSVDEDDLDRKPVCEPRTVGCPVKITDLFDFKRVHWVDTYQRSALRSFDEELELYELLDCDSGGAQAANVDVDGLTEDLLLG
jgi:hypothetical protein